MKYLNSNGFRFAIIFGPKLKTKYKYPATSKTIGIGEPRNALFSDLGSELIWVYSLYYNRNDDTLCWEFTSELIKIVIISII